jgi:hypothetical protein
MLLSFAMMMMTSDDDECQACEQGVDNDDGPPMIMTVLVCGGCEVLSILSFAMCDRRVVVDL